MRDAKIWNSIPNYSDTVKINIPDNMPSSLLQMLRLRKLIGHAKSRLLFKLLTISNSYQGLFFKYDIYTIHQCPFLYTNRTSFSNPVNVYYHIHYIIFLSVVICGKMVVRRWKNFAPFNFFLSHKKHFNVYNSWKKRWHYLPLLAISQI